MCMVIDANTISCVFSGSNTMHSSFLPVLRWFVYGRAKICLGGKLLSVEQKKLVSYQPLFKELGKLNKIHKIDDSLINKKEKEITDLEKDSDFDDPHIIALIIVSKAKVLCSDDSRSFKFVRRIKKYDKKSEVPKIYTTINNHSLPTGILSDENICDNGSHVALNKRTADYLWEHIEKRDFK